MAHRSGSVDAVPENDRVATSIRLRERAGDDADAAAEDAVARGRLPLRAPAKCRRASPARVRRARAADLCAVENGAARETPIGREISFGARLAAGGVLEL